MLNFLSLHSFPSIKKNKQKKNKQPISAQTADGKAAAFFPVSKDRLLRKHLCPRFILLSTVDKNESLGARSRAGGFCCAHQPAVTFRNRNVRRLRWSLVKLCDRRKSTWSRQCGINATRLFNRRDWHLVKVHCPFLFDLMGAFAIFSPQTLQILPELTLFSNFLLYRDDG